MNLPFLKTGRTERFAALLGLVLAFALIPALRADPSKVTAQLDPEDIAIGDASQLTVTIGGSASGQPSLPSVPGLEFTPIGQSSNFQFINGSISNSTSYSYQVTADHAGTFAIPEIAVGSLRSNRVTLTVGAAVGASSNTGGAAASASQPGTPLPPPATGGPQDQTAAPSNGEIAFLRFSLPKHELYVGETVPVRLGAYFVAGTQASLDGLPTLANDSIILNPITAKGTQTQEDVNGQPYEVIFWDASLTAVKAGSVTLDLSLPVTALVRVHANRPHGMGGLFDDPFFDQAFGTVVQKQLTLRNDPLTLQVLPLPDEDRPADFSGAVGDFSIAADVSPREAAEGDPLTLKFMVNGHGSFDRVLPSLMTGMAGWKTYAANIHFDPQDTVGYQGTKTFEQAIVPTQPGKQEVPALSFSYFDPETHRYATKTTAPLEVTIAAAPVSAQVAASTTATNTSPAAAPAPRTELMANRLEPGRFTPSLQPLFLQPWFYGMEAAPLAVLAAAIGLLSIRRKRENDLKRTRCAVRDRAIREQWNFLDQAAAAGNAVPFFHAARAILQEGLGERWQLPPETITLAEIESRETEVSPGVRAVFERADQIAYSGQAFGADDFAAWKHAVADELAAMETV